MTKQSGSFTAIYFAGYDLSGLSNQIDFNLEYAEADTTGFLEGCENSIPDIPKGSAAITTFLDPDTDKSHDALVSPGSYIDHCLCILSGNNAAPTIGDAAFAMVCKQFSYVPKIARKSAILADVSMNSAGEEVDVNGIVLANTTITDTTTFTAVNTTEFYSRAVAYLQILTPTSTDSYVIKVQTSSDGDSYVDKITFVADGQTRTSELSDAASSMYPYLRVIATRTGAAGDDLKLCVVFVWKGTLVE